MWKYTIICEFEKVCFPANDFHVIKHRLYAPRDLDFEHHRVIFDIRCHGLNIGYWFSYFPLLW